MINDNKTEKRFDKEYSTQYIPEVKYLESLNIKYTFVKDVNGITTYKYTKTSDLFDALTLYYKMNGCGGNNEC